MQRHSTISSRGVLLRTAMLGLLAALLVIGCDSNTAGGTDAATQTDAGTNPDASIQADANTQSDAAPQSDASPQPDSAVGDAAVDPDSAVTPDAGHGPDGGSGDLVITWSSASMWANCMPMVPPDPWNGTIDLTYDNTAGSTPAHATVLGARMIFQVTGSPAINITVNPTAVGPIAAGTSATRTHTKTGSTNDLPGDCGYCSNTVVFEVTLNVGGQQVLVTSPAQAVNCAY